ncbi:MAG: WG repeat-containing protein [Bacteroidales bacterium]|jgi:hypothetical protein|nr:WG repeat-containing protein [Bacteroidales bacterium]
MVSIKLKSRNILLIAVFILCISSINTAMSQNLDRTPFYWKVSLDYDEVSSLNGSFFAVRNGDKWGVVKNNQTIIPCKYEAIDALGDDMISFVDNGLIGFADTLGNMKIKPYYATENKNEITDNVQLNIFYDGSCVVYDNNTQKYLLINKEGERLLGDSVEIVCRMNNAVVIKRDDAYGMTDGKGNPTYETTNIKIEMVTPLLFSYTMRQLNGNLLKGLLNAKGEKRSEAIYTDFQPYSKEGRQYVKAYEPNGLQALYEENGTELFSSLYQVAEATVLPDYFKVIQDLGTGIIERKDSLFLVHLQPVYSDVRIITTKDTFLVAKSDNITSIFYLNGKKLYEGNFNVIDIVPTSDGYRLVVEKDFNYGVIDPTGQVIIDTKYHEVYAVVGLWLAVRRKNEWGAVNILTKEEIEPAFDRIKLSNDRSYVVLVGNRKKSLLIKNTNEVIEFPSCDDVFAMNSYVEYKVKKKAERLYLNGTKIPPMFLVIGSAHNGLIPVQVKKGWTYVDDKTYQIKTEEYYKAASQFFDGYAVVAKDMKLIVIDTNFNELGTILEAKDKIPSLIYTLTGFIALNYYANAPFIKIANSGKQGILGIKQK